MQFVPSTGDHKKVNVIMHAGFGRPCCRCGSSPYSEMHSYTGAQYIAHTSFSNSGHTHISSRNQFTRALDSLTGGATCAISTKADPECKTEAERIAPSQVQGPVPALRAEFINALFLPFQTYLSLSLVDPHLPWVMSSLAVLQHQHLPTVQQ
jgi:hypothetical protein